MERVQREQQADRADHARQDEAGVHELEDQRVDPDDDHDVGDRRVGDHAEDLGAPVDLDFDHRRVRLAELLEELRDVGGDVLDDLELERLLRRQAHRLAHRLLGPVGVPATHLGEPADIGDGVVGDLPRHGVFACFPSCRLSAARPADRHRRRRARGWSRRHGRDMARVQDEGAGARGARAARRDEGGHRHRRGEDVLDQAPHRGVEPARGVHAHDHELRLILRGALDRAAHEIRRRGADGAVERHHQHRRGLRRAAARPQMMLSSK